MKRLLLPVLDDNLRKSFPNVLISQVAERLHLLVSLDVNFEVFTTIYLKFASKSCDGLPMNHFPTEAHEIIVLVVSH